MGDTGCFWEPGNTRTGRRRLEPADGLARAGCGSVMRPERLERTNVFQRSPATGAEEIACRVRREKGRRLEARQNKALLPPLVCRPGRSLQVATSSDERAQTAIEDETNTLLNTTTSTSRTTSNTGTTSTNTTSTS